MKNLHFKTLNKKVMKTLIKISAVLVILIFVTASCKQQDAATILANKSLRNEIMTSIAGNHEMSMEMMNAMMNNEHGKMMLQGNTQMMKMMMGDQKTMQNMMKENPELMHNMMNAMMNAVEGDSTNMKYMRQQMMDHPQMMAVMNGKESGMGMMN